MAQTAVLRADGASAAEVGTVRDEFLFSYLSPGGPGRALAGSIGYRSNFLAGYFAPQHWLPRRSESPFVGWWGYALVSVGAAISARCSAGPTQQRKFIVSGATAALLAPKQA